MSNSFEKQDNPNPNSNSAKVRMAALRHELELSNIDIILITKTADIRWLSGFTQVFDDEPAHQLLLAQEPFICAYLFSDARYIHSLDGANTRCGSPFVLVDKKRPRLSLIAEYIYDCAAQLNIENRTLRVAIESDLRLDWYRALCREMDLAKIDYQLVENSSPLPKLRAKKDAQEVAALKRAQAITDATFLHMLEYLHVGVSEKQAVWELERFMCQDGNADVAFASIVAFGENSAKPHVRPTDRRLKAGDFVLMDFGARVDDYCSDMTRTVIVGKATSHQRAIYESVQAAQKAAIEALRPGLGAMQAQKIAESVIAKHGFSGKFTHALGHGLGLDVHELPTLATNVEMILEVGHVLTVEPGIYIEGLGGVRIEDFGMITQAGFENFTASTHELIEL